MKRKRKRWVKTKDAEKDGKEEEKIGEGRKKRKRIRDAAFF